MQRSLDKLQGHSPPQSWRIQLLQHIPLNATAKIAGLLSERICLSVEPLHLCVALIYLMPFIGWVLELRCRSELAELSDRQVLEMPGYLELQHSMRLERNYPI